MDRKERNCEEDLEKLTKSARQGKLIGEVAKIKNSSSSSIRGKKLLGWSPFFNLGELLTAYKSVRKGKKKKEQKIPSYSESNCLDDSELTLLGRYDKNSFWEILKLYAELNILKNYKITKYSAFTVPKNNGAGRRTIFSPHPRDRIVFTAVLNRIREKFSNLDDLNILGLGINGQKDNPHNYFQQIQKDILRHKWFRKIDISNYFPSIDRDMLLNELKNLGIGARELKIIKESIYCELDIFHKTDRPFFQAHLKGMGIPQGCAYSPLIANQYFSDIDLFLKRRKVDYYRFLDDIIFFADSPGELQKTFEEIKRRAAKKGLEVKHEKDAHGRTTEAINFLGIEILSEKLTIPQKSIDKLIRHISSHCQKELDSQSEKKVRRHLKEIVKGWGDYYALLTPEDFNKKMGNVNRLIVSCFEKMSNISSYVTDESLQLGGFEYKTGNNKHSNFKENNY